MKPKTFFLAFLALVMALNSLGLTFSGALAADPTLSKKVVFGKEYDEVVDGKVGVYMPSSAFDATLGLTLTTPDSSKPFKDTQMKFVQRWANISMTRTNGKQFDQVFGLIYLYFNLTEADRKLYDEGRLSIYRYIAEDKDWKACDALVFLKNENKPNGRLACVISKFGQYTLAESPTGRNSAIEGETLVQRVQYSREYDFAINSTGVYTPKSAYTGRLELTQSDPDGKKPFAGMTFQGKWMDLRIYNSTGKVQTRAYGLIYAYFNLTADQRTLYDKGKLSIYTWNESDAKWVACPVVVFLKGENKPNGRLACVIKEFGLYTLAAKP
jgi:hypothetical protein